MEEITQAAKATYENLPVEEKNEIEKTFKLIDRDGDGKVSVQEFKAYLTKKRDHAKVNSNLFNLIDQNGDGNLNFDEVLTLFYIIESGRSVCDGCGNFIQGLFFTCIECHYSKPAEDGYNICIACYKPGGFVHDHTEFLDNYKLFVEMKKNGAGSARTQTYSPDQSFRGGMAPQQTYSPDQSFRGGMAPQQTYSPDQSFRGGMAPQQTNSPDQSSNGGVAPPRIRKRDKLKRPFKALGEMVTGVATVATLYSATDELLA